MTKCFYNFTTLEKYTELLGLSSCKRKKKEKNRSHNAQNFRTEAKASNLCAVAVVVNAVVDCRHLHHYYQ